MSTPPSINLLDSEAVAIADAIAPITSRANQMSFMEFGDNIKEALGAIGFVAYVVWHFDDREVPHDLLEFTLSIALPGQLSVPTPEIAIVGRIGPTPDFDHERMMFEVQNDIAGMGTPGAMRPDGTLVSPSQSTAFITKKG